MSIFPQSCFKGNIYMSDRSAKFPLPCLIPRTVELAFQIATFRSTDSPYRDQFDSETIDCIDFVVSRYPLPRLGNSTGLISVQGFVSTSRPEIRRTDRLVYPADWTVDRSTVNKAVADFLRAAPAIVSSAAFETWIQKVPRPGTRKTAGKTTSLPFKTANF
jgi:hypothetical protein